MSHDAFQDTRVTEDGVQQQCWESGISATCGGSAGQLGPERMARIGDLLKKLPPSIAHNPPLGRRLRLQVDMHKHFSYDRANLPGVIVDLLRATRSSIPAYLPKLTPSSAGPVPVLPSTKRLYMRPDGKRALTLDFWERAKLYDPGDWSEIGQFEVPMVWEPGIDFTTDGKYILGSGGEGKPLLAWDATTGTPLPDLPEGLPGDAVNFVGAPACGIYATSGKEVRLWVNGQDVAVLDRDCTLSSVAFSSREPLAAAMTMHPTDPTEPNPIAAGNGRLRIWRTDTGALVHELMVSEVFRPVGNESVLWSPDGRFVIAGKELWDAATGRSKGELDFSDGSPKYLVFLPDGRLAAHISEGKTRVWEMKKITADLAKLAETLK